MKKRLLSALATSSLVGVSLVAAVAQACTSTDPQTTQRIEMLVSAVNEFSSYNVATTTPSAGLAEELLNALNSRILVETQTHTLRSMQFAPITNNNVRVTNSGTTFTATINDTSGTITNPALMVNGNITVTASVTNTNDFAISTNTGVGGLEFVMSNLFVLIEAVNEFRSYNSSSSVISNGLATEFLTALNNQIDTQSSGNAATTLDFNTIVPENVVVSNNDSMFVVTFNNVTGTLTDQLSVISGNFTVTATLNNSGVVTISSNNSVSEIPLVPSSVLQLVNTLNDGSIRDYSTSNGGIIPGSLQETFFSALGTEIGSGVFLFRFGFNMINASNITVTMDNQATTLTARLPGIFGNGLSDASSNFTLSGQDTGDSIMVVFSNVDTGNVNNFRVDSINNLNVDNG